jgi:hypothetical protein
VGAAFDDATKCLICLLADLKTDSATPVLVRSGCHEQFITVHVKRTGYVKDVSRNVRAALHSGHEVFLFLQIPGVRRQTVRAVSRRQPAACHSVFCKLLASA